jgi:hypothetical protein
MKHFFLILAIAILAAWSQDVWSETIIYGTEIPGLHQIDGMGAYDKIINEILIKPGLASLQVHPPKRTEKNFSTCQNCCFSPANKNPDFYDFGEDIVKTEPMNTAKVYIFTAKGQKTINRLEDLKGKKVGIRFGMPYGKKFESAGLNVYPAEKTEINIKNLDKGRLDAFVEYVPDAYVAFKNLGIPPYPHDIANPIAVHEDCLVCRGVSDDFVTTFNQKLKKMSESGQLKEILGDSYIEQTK